MEPEPFRSQTPFSERLLGLIEQKPASDRLLLRVLFFAVIASALFLILSFSASFISETPAQGGSLVEGVIGTPRFVNPVLAISRADQDVSALVFSGLMKLSPGGEVIPDLAESITLSEDGKTYHIRVKESVRFHDDTPLTAQDVAFTINLIQNPDLKSPLRGNWNDVTVEVLNEYELTVTLAEPYAPFLENFTVGILPRHIWGELPIEQLPFSQHNTEPIGAGPFRLKDVNRTKSGLISSYTLTRFTDAVEPPKLESITVRFFDSEAAAEAAFFAGEITSTAHFTNEGLQNLNYDKNTVITTPLPRTFGIFFNQNRSTVLRDDAARAALDAALDRDMIVDSALSGYGIPITSPVPPDFLTVQSGATSTPSSSLTSSSSLEVARTILREGGWVQQKDGTWEKEINEVPYILAVTLRTSNAPLFEQTANAVSARWQELGVLVNAEQFEQADLLQSVIRPRDFEALLFGTDLSRAVDLYPFWHSSQKDDPGLNIAQYANLEVDDLLELARATTSEAASEAIAETERIIKEERPALFLFTPVMTYVISKEVTPVDMERLSRPYERFMNIEEWHAKTGALWPIFDQN